MSFFQCLVLSDARNVSTVNFRFGARGQGKTPVASNSGFCFEAYNMIYISGSKAQHMLQVELCLYTMTSEVDNSARLLETLIVELACCSKSEVNPQSTQ